MITKCFVVITIVSFVYAIFGGNAASLTNAVIDGASKSIKISLELCGMSCLWCGIMEVFRDTGVLRVVSRVMSPILSRVFPDAWKTKDGKEEITAAVSANILGIGNAATPYALSAMKKLDLANKEFAVTSGDMAAFAILGTASLNIIPTTLILLRRAAGSADPYSIIVPIWICSFSCAALGVILSYVCRKVSKSGEKTKKSGTEKDKVVGRSYSSSEKSCKRRDKKTENLCRQFFGDSKRETSEKTGRKN